VVYDDDSAAAAELMGAQVPRVGRYVDVEALPPGASLLPVTMAVKRLQQMGAHPRGPAAGHVPACWDAFAKHLSPPAGPAGAFLFMRERTSPAGVRRLVILQRTVGKAPRPSFWIGVDLDAALLEPGTATMPPRWAPIQQFAFAFSGQVPATSPRLRMFAGQADPADASHFTIGYELDGEPGTIDGWLQADGRGLRIQVRDRPARR
jgi:hypothetical protein